MPIAMLVATAFVLSALVLLDGVLPPGQTVMALLAAVPATAMLDPVRPCRALAAGWLTSAVAIPLGALHWSGQPVVVVTSAIGIVYTTMMMWLACRRQRDSDTAQADLRAVAGTMQRALLRPVPLELGPVSVQVRYLAATAQAQVGGDLYDVLSTPYGVRLIMGDARGKGLVAVEKAADVLGAFRELAHHERSLSGVALRLDAFLAARGGDEDFVTALLVEIPASGGRAELISCGHPPALLLAGGSVSYVEALCPAPPLGLMGMGDGGWAPVTITFRPGERLLLYTDGVSEARDAAGRFFPLTERVSGSYGHDARGLVDALETQLKAHAGGRLDDDAAMLLLDAGPTDQLVPRQTTAGENADLALSALDRHAKGR
ncbi:serine/threonine-protein phosphatase [Actinomadura barringtoniae]|uniref:Serine/threonine-protein phosphatase n=1 Tax=Actinomadura barringtoniae TaxID=1427535 RepID=A0A939PTA5_9ACTN|nr:PP2C family protein-serine/threonine phosphatase [Actinomadura barringtoniae]MBO2455849.1 serine/threonine-protein phosphatase [Actinomadura barringtoniae]